jgi:hypothetical protein
MIKWLLAFVLGFGLVCHSQQALAIQPTLEKPVAVLRALDKITARVQELIIPLNTPRSFGTLTITVRTCKVTAPEEQPEVAAFIDITDIKPGERELPVFHGWMFASSPALSALEHPVYDVWVTGCKDAATK